MFKMIDKYLLKKNPPRWLTVRTFASHTEYQGSISDRDRLIVHLQKLLDLILAGNKSFKGK